MYVNNAKWWLRAMVLSKTMVNFFFKLLNENEK